MAFSVPHNRIEWSLEFGSVSVTVIAKDLVQQMKVSSQELILAAWSLLLSQRQDFWKKHLERVPITLNQEGTLEIRDDVLSSVGAQNMDTSGYQLSDRDHVEFYW